MRIISELHSKWRCTKHSKHHDVYCYSTDGNVCLTLTHGNMLLQLQFQMLLLGVLILTSMRNIIGMVLFSCHIGLDSSKRFSLYLSTYFGFHSAERFARLAWD